MTSRVAFFRTAAVLGVRCLLDVTGHVGRAGVLLGIPIAVSAAGFVILDRGWIPLVASISTLALVTFAEGPYRTGAVEKERPKILGAPSPVQAKPSSQALLDGDLPVDQIVQG